MNIIFNFLIFFRFHNVLFGVLLVLTGGFLGLGKIQITDSLVIAMVSILVSCMGCVALNNYWDKEVDKIVHPLRAQALDSLTPRFAYLSGFFLFICAFITGIFVSTIFILFLIIGFMLFLFYEQRTKNRGLSGNITVAIALPLILISGGVAVNNPFPSSIIFFISVPPVLGGEILRDIRDVKGDEMKRHTLPMSIGISAAKTLGIGLVVTYLFLSLVPYVMNLVNLWYLPGVVIADILIIAVTAFAVKKNCSVRIVTEVTKVAFIIGLFSLIIGIY